ncbi:hypothetical protein Tco_0763017, partial [Tanacetum coccineum]
MVAEKKTVAIEDQTQKPWWANNNRKIVIGPRNLMLNQRRLLLWCTAVVEQDDWRMEFDAEHVHFGEDGLGDFDWSNKDDDTPVSLALMATNSEGSRGTRPVWNNIQRVNHSNFARNSRNPHQRRSFIPSAVLTRDGLISTVRPKMTQAVPSKSTANVTYQGAARSRVPQAVLSRSTDGSYYPRLDSRRPRISRYSPSSRSSTTRTPHRPQRPKKIVKMIWVKKGSTVGSQAVLPQTVKKSAMISPKQTWKPKGNYLDSVN